MNESDCKLSPTPKRFHSWIKGHCVYCGVEKQSRDYLRRRGKQMNDTPTSPSGSPSDVPQQEINAIRKDPEKFLDEEIQRYRLSVENEWQTTQEWIDDENFAEADYFCTRAIHQLENLRIDLKLRKGMTNE